MCFFRFGFSTILIRLTLETLKRIGDLLCIQQPKNLVTGEAAMIQLASTSKFNPGHDNVEAVLFGDIVASRNSNAGIP
jgi:hypothetical protein